jgi:hypothetical protein
MSIRKHFGAIKNTGAQIIVVFRSLPEDPTNCLVVENNTIPEKYYDAVINLANSSDAQNPTCNNFYEVLNRNIFSDGRNMLQALHFNGLLRKVPVDNVVLLPQPGRELPLAMANEAIDGTSDGEISKDLPKTTDVKSSPTMKDDVENKPQQTFDMGDPVAVAEGLLLEAELLKASAIKKEQEAYALAPELKPETTGKRGRPPKTDAQKAATKEAAKERRNARERNQRKLAKKENADKALKEAVDAKVVRDAEAINHSQE